MIAKPLPILAALCVAALGCSPGEPPPVESPPPVPSEPALDTTAHGTPVKDAAPTVVFLGTSLTAGLGLDPALAYPALVQAKIEAAGLPHRVVNAGVSGETSAGALRRIDWLMQKEVAVLVVETGANDGLRGQDPDALRANVQAIFDRARKQSPPPRLVLVAMEALTNYGADYVARFRAVFPELAKANEATLVPFLLEGVAGVRSLNQADGIHPTAEGHVRMAETVWAVLRPVLEADARSRQAAGG
jgi:acyl-CoA thioesterase-1